MIYTLTLNPAVDYVVHTDTLTPGGVLRGREEQIFIGGKGINVSLVLNSLGVPSVALGLCAGFTGQYLKDQLTAQGVAHDFICLEEGFTRINVKIRDGRETDVNAAGPHIGPDTLARLFDRLQRVGDDDILVLAGSLPPSLPENTYARIMEALKGCRVRYVVDTTGASLLATLPYRPFLIKPNKQELAEALARDVDTPDDIDACARRLKEMGARNVLVSLGADGAVLLDEDGRKHTVTATPGRVINTVGAGDSMVAGFLAGYLQSGDVAYALKVGEASGSATAFSAGLADASAIRAILRREGRISV